MTDNQNPARQTRTMGTSGMRRVIGSCVTVDAHSYGSPALEDGQKVFVRLDPDRSGLANIYSPDQSTLIAVAFCPELIPTVETGGVSISDQLHQFDMSIADRVSSLAADPWRCVSRKLSSSAEHRQVDNRAPNTPSARERDR